MLGTEHRAHSLGAGSLLVGPVSGSASPSISKALASGAGTSAEGALREEPNRRRREGNTRSRWTPTVSTPWCAWWADLSSAVITRCVTPLLGSGGRPGMLRGPRSMSPLGPALAPTNRGSSSSTRRG